MTTGGIDPAVQRRLDRLAAIGQALAAHPGGLALLALGSLGPDVARADAYSDLDFFAIAEPWAVAELRDDLGWLAAVCPIVFGFANTPDGSKILFEDGLFAEFAVFCPEQLPHIRFEPGRIVWARPGLDVAQFTPLRPAEKTDPDWAILEALTCLLIGLGRFRRGEILAAHRMIQGHALDLTLLARQALAPSPDQPAMPVEAWQRLDPFNPARRIETVAPDRIPWLHAACAGYGQSDRAAQAILTELGQLGPLPPALVAAIEALL